MKTWPGMESERMEKKGCIRNNNFHPLIIESVHGLIK
jgi:hypothetical protein